MRIKCIADTTHQVSCTLPYALYTQAVTPLTRVDVHKTARHVQHTTVHRKGRKRRHSPCQQQRAIVWTNPAALLKNRVSKCLKVDQSTPAVATLARSRNRPFAATSHFSLEIFALAAALKLSKQPQSCMLLAPLCETHMPSLGALPNCNAIPTASKQQAIAAVLELGMQLPTVIDLLLYVTAIGHPSHRL